MFLRRNVLKLIRELEHILKYRTGAPPSQYYNSGGFGKKKKYSNNNTNNNKSTMQFGKKNFIQEANKKSRQKGTVGLFGKWCRSKGLATADGKVTSRCINSAKKSGNVKIIRRAVFAQNIGGYAGAKHKRKTSFGEQLNTYKKYLNLLKIN